jgi:hypothetical protein
MKYKKYERSEKKETRCDINLFRSYHIISTRVFFLLKMSKFRVRFKYNVIVQNMFVSQRMNAFKNMFRMHIWTPWILSICDVVRMNSNYMLLSR